ncbi:hypothetical protein J2S43_001276 [Catenuloplanes nepalensis]|uniref:Transmembrane anti-sigma factor n=1 Tax=Catenuloplanes nepalensis TaxID=587533 RepID=A0ABT9MMV2_9ACTN|nr:hypothetical protein [Catenuloplanes nepalensis]MDP9792764.1 hypothetical protein [Catenuloplanes nepalensis]
MRHPAEGTLRRLADEPSAITDPDRAHVAACPDCQETLSTVRKEAALIGAALHTEAAPDVDAGWRRLSDAFAAPMTAAEAIRVGRRAPVPRWRGPMVAVAAVVALLTGATAAVATDWLRVFHTEEIAPVTISRADLLALPDLSAYGDVEVTEEPHVRDVPDAAAASEATGLAVPEVTSLPRGVSGQPVYQAGDRVTAVFTFDGDRAGGPPELDGARFRLTAGPGVAAVWAEDRGVPALIVGRAVAPAAYSDSGVDFATARDHLLSLSGLPADVAAQLRAFTGDGTTLPLHVMDEKLTSAPADVNGAPATVLTSRDGVLAAVVWVRDGVVTAVAGSLSADEVLTVARGLA